MQNQKPVDDTGYTKEKYLFYCIAFLFGLFFFGWLFFVVAPSPGLLGWISIIVFGGYTVLMFVGFLNFKPVQILEENLPNPAIDFYKGCIADGVNEINSSQGQARLSLYLKNHNIQMDLESAKKQYEHGMNELERLEQKKRQKELDAKRNELIEYERRYEELSKKYISFFGQDKAVQMCLDEAAIYHKIIEECDNQRKQVYKNSENAYRAFSQKEHDWAIHGGLASGLAGGAAGLAAASRISNKNQAIRSSNQRLDYAITNMAVDQILDINEKSLAAKKEAELWEKRATDLKKCLVQELPADELLAKLNPTLINQTQSESTALELTIETNAVSDLLIYENVSAVADGFIKAIIWDDNKKLGEAFFSLPYCGATSKFALSSICRSNLLEHGKDYSITFEADNLWAIEKPKG